MSRWIPWLSGPPDPPLPTPTLSEGRITDHGFTPVDYGGRVFCGHVQVTDGVGQVCERPENEHAPASEETTGAGNYPFSVEG